MTLSNPQRTHKGTTSLPPCAIRYHPSIPDLLFLGTYHLDKPSGARMGTLEIYNESPEGRLTLHSIRKADSAILDLRFDPFDDTLIYTAGSTGDFKIWRFQDDELTSVHKFQLCEEEVLITSIIPSHTIQNRILVTSTDGYVSLLTLTNDGHGVFSQQLDYFESSHSLQCWIASFGNFDALSNVVFSGGDDAVLIAHDMRAKMPIWQSPRLHDAGVVSIRTATPGNHHGNGDWSITKPYTLLTGSYDDCIRDLDLRYVPNVGLLDGLVPRVNESLNLGGGVWKMEPCTTPGDDRLAVCCMYDGGRVLRRSDDGLQVDAYFKKDHESMVYGCDWSLDANRVASCSFYDNVVQIWSVNDTNE